MEAPLRTVLLFAPWLGLLLGACDSGHDEDARLPGKPSLVAKAPGAKIEVPPPPFTEGIFPCKECHDPEIPVNTQRRQLKLAHEDIVLHHDEEHRWCLDCHAEKDRDKLHLANGELIEFTESYKLCGQCHGDKYRDWLAGVHGRRSGEWKSDGHKTYLLCVNCHYSHAPAFRLDYVAPFRQGQPKSAKPEPMPVRPENLAKGSKEKAQ